jgi:IPT/TIG domain
MDSKTLKTVGWVVFAALIALMAYEIVASFAPSLARFGPWQPTTWGLLVVVLAYALSVALTGSLNPLAIGLGDDGKLSLSKSQTLFWTFIVLYAFSAIYARDVELCASGKNHTCPQDATGTTSTTGGNTTTTTSNAANGAGDGASGGASTTAPPLGASALIPIEFPGSVLLLLGFSVTSLVAAAGITRSQIASGTVKKGAPASTEPDYSPKWLVLEDDGHVDLTRFQVVLWTVVAAGAFLSDTQLLLTSGGFLRSLPDVGSALVLLMGIGQAAYIGGKLVVTPKPHIFRLTPAHGAAGTQVTASGAGFGATQQPTSFVLMNDAPVPAANVTSWSDTAIVFSVPNAPPAGGAWAAPSTTAQVTVATGPVQSDPVAFTVP